MIQVLQDTKDFNIKQCDGCTAYDENIIENCNLLGRYVEYKNTISLMKLLNCPCIECIVKPMCKKYCKQWVNHDDRLPNH